MRPTLRALLLLSLSLLAACRHQLRAPAQRGLRVTNFLEGPVAAVAYRLCGESGGYTPLPGSYLPAGRSVLFAEEMQPECFDLVALDAQQRVVGVLPNVERGASSRWVIR